ncbi:MAG: TlpA family protein disulfide reductase [Clostridiales bacterium]|nr:TlpA family protein disulfide reductase [Clostridiales bacterium]
MNKVIYAVLICCLLSLQTSNGNISITGIITGEVPELIYYSIPINGVCYWGFSEAVKPDSLGNFQINLYSDKPAFIIIRPNGFPAKKVIVEPDQKYIISIEIAGENIIFHVAGLNERGQNLYNTIFPLDVFLDSESDKFMNDSSVTKIKDKLSVLKSNNISKFKEMLDNNDISPLFFNLMKREIDCYYATLSTTIALRKFYNALRTNKDYPQDIKQFCEEIFEKFPVLNESLMSSYLWIFYADNYIHFRDMTRENFNVDEISKLYNEGLIHTHHINESKKWLSGIPLEYYTAYYIYFQSFQKKFEKELINLFEQFNQNYPESKFTRYLKPMVRPIREYHQTIERPFSERILFVHDYENIKSLKNALAQFAGKKIYIDVWATWCGPCKAEFKHSAKLHELLESKNIEMLYISIDDSTREKQWEGMIKYYDLEGNHIRASKELLSELYTIYNQQGTILIPWYILIDENGNILKLHASRPSTIQDLEKELNDN